MVRLEHDQPLANAKCLLFRTGPAAVFWDLEALPAGKGSKITDIELNGAVCSERTRLTKREAPRISVSRRNCRLPEGESGSIARFFSAFRWQGDSNFLFLHGDVSQPLGSIEVFGKTPGVVAGREGRIRSCDIPVATQTPYLPRDRNVATPYRYPAPLLERGVAIQKSGIIGVSCPFQIGPYGFMGGRLRVSFGSSCGCLPFFKQPASGNLSPYRRIWGVGCRRWEGIVNRGRC